MFKGVKETKGLFITTARSLNGAKQYAENLPISGYGENYPSLAESTHEFTDNFWLVAQIMKMGTDSTQLVA